MNWYRNGEGYSDPTMAAALRNAERDERRKKRGKNRKHKEVCRRPVRESGECDHSRCRAVISERKEDISEKPVGGSKKADGAGTEVFPEQDVRDSDRCRSGISHPET